MFEVDRLSQRLAKNWSKQNNLSPKKVGYSLVGKNVVYTAPACVCAVLFCMCLIWVCKKRELILDKLLPSPYNKSCFKAIPLQLVYIIKGFPSPLMQHKTRDKYSGLLNVFFNEQVDFI